MAEFEDYSSFEGLELGHLTSQSFLETQNAATPTYQQNVFLQDSKSSPCPPAGTGMQSEVVTQKVHALVGGGIERITCFKGQITGVSQTKRVGNTVEFTTWTPSGKLTRKSVSEKIDDKTTRTVHMNGRYEIESITIRKVLKKRQCQMTSVKPDGTIISNKVVRCANSGWESFQNAAQDLAPMAATAAAVLAFIPGAQGAAAVAAGIAIALEAAGSGKIDAKAVRNVGTAVNAEYGPEGKAGYELAVTVMEEKPITDTIMEAVPLAKKQADEVIDMIGSIKAKVEDMPEAQKMSDYEIEKILSGLPVGLSAGIKAGIIIGGAQAIEEGKKTVSKNIKKEAQRLPMVSIKLILARAKRRAYQERNKTFVGRIQNKIESFWENFVDFLEEGI